MTLIYLNHDNIMDNIAATHQKACLISKFLSKDHNTLEAVFPSLVSHSATISNFLFKIPLIHDLLPTNENGHLGKLYPLISNISPYLKLWYACVIHLYTIFSSTTNLCSSFPLLNLDNIFAKTSITGLIIRPIHARKTL